VEQEPTRKTKQTSRKYMAIEENKKVAAKEQMIATNLLLCIYLKTCYIF